MKQTPAMEATRQRINDRSLLRDCPVCPSKVGERCVDKRSAKIGRFIVNYYPHKERLQ